MAKQNVLVPTIMTPRPNQKDENGVLLGPRYDPDFLGYKVDRYKVIVNYHDCMKVEAHGPASVLSSLAAAGRDHFNALWINAGNTNAKRPDTEE